MYKKAWCTCKVVVLHNKPIAFLTSPLPSPSSLLKLPSIQSPRDIHQSFCGDTPLRIPNPYQRHHVQIDKESLGKQIPDWLKEPNAHLRGIRSQHVALRTAVKLGAPTWDRNIAWTLSICNASSASLASSGKTTSPTVRYSHVLEPQHVLRTQSAPPEMVGAWS